MNIKCIGLIISVCFLSQTAIGAGEQGVQPDKAMHLKRAAIYLQQGKGMPAEQEIQKAKQLGANWQEWGIPLGQAYLMQHHFSQVLEHFSTLPGTPTQSERLNILLLRSEANIGLRQFDVAQTILNEVLSLEPSNVKAFTSLGQIHILKRELSLAQQYLQRALNGPLESHKQKAEIIALQGELKKIQGDVLGAAKSYHTAMHLDKTNLKARAGLAELIIAERIQDPYSEEAEEVHTLLN